MFSQNTDLNELLEITDLDELFSENSNFNSFSQEELDYETQQLLEDF